MRGRITGQSNLFVNINLEDLVPADHPLRAIKPMADQALAEMGRTFAAAYSPVGKADGYAERTCGLKMLSRVKRKQGLEPATLGADKGYDAEDFLLALGERGIQPHVACKSRREMDVPREDDNGAWARWFNQRGQGDEDFKTSQRKRRQSEEIFGWLKQFGGLRRARVLGR